MESTAMSSISHFGARPETGFSRKAVRTISDQRPAFWLKRCRSSSNRWIIRAFPPSVDLWVCASRPNRVERFAGDRPIPCFALGLCPSARVRKCFRWTHAITMMMPALSLPLPPSRGKGIWIIKVSIGQTEDHHLSFLPLLAVSRTENTRTRR